MITDREIRNQQIVAHKWSEIYPGLFDNYASECTVQEEDMIDLDHNMGFYRDPEGYGIGDCIDRIEDETSRLHHRLTFFHCEFLDTPNPVRDCRKTYQGRYFLLPKSIENKVLHLAQNDKWTEIYDLLSKQNDLVRVRCN
jgi:hypothetical protein